VVRRGEVYLCDFGTPIGHEAGLRRPAVVITHDEMNRDGVPIVAPETRTPRGYATHVELDGAMPVVSYVQCELLRAVAIDRLIRPVASLDHLHMARIEMSLAASGPHVAAPPGRSDWHCCRTPTAPVATTGTERQAAIQGAR